MWWSPVLLQPKKESFRASCGSLALACAQKRKKGDFPVCAASSTYPFRAANNRIAIANCQPIYHIWIPEMKCNV